MSVFVMEIGTEELPARFLSGLEQEIASRFEAALAAANVEFGTLNVQSTPRRLALTIENIDAVQREAEEVVSGPPVRIAFDAQGRPTKAAEGFARTQGAELDELFTLTTDKGEYLAVRKKTGGRPVQEILSEVAPEIIAALPFPKKMKWGSGDFTFGRPLRWVLALFDSEVVPFTVAGIVSGNETCGHRVHGPGPFEVSGADAYAGTVRDKCHVTLCAADRRRVTVEGGDALAAQAGGRILWKDSLLDEVQGLCEHPVPCLGDFDPSFLELPAEVLLTSMESHQKSFGVAAADGSLMPHFLTVLNMTPQNSALVKKGWERVLRARLEDARFFWKADLASDFDSWLAKLDNVIFLAPLGSMGDKTRRLERLCRWLAAAVAPDIQEQAARAGRLSKADLVSEMVYEFDSLQGIMGGIYARRKGEDEIVAQAVSEQYLPAGPESPVPDSLCGALLSIADKADTLAGCFGLSMIPTGAADPYALRRCALGIARIMLEKGLRFDVRELFRYAQEGYGERQWKLEPEQAAEKLHEFFVLRLKNLFVSQGHETLLVEAALHAGADDVWAAGARLEALDRFSKSAEFGQAVLTFKRAANIIRKQGQEEDGGLDGCYDASLFEDEAEKALASALEDIAPDFEARWAADDYHALFGLLGVLRPAVDAFFDSVMVMCEDPHIRRNRLNLLQSLVQRLGRLADFGALQM
jgi:glycyl-tRNA synthetase beta chain